MLYDIEQATDQLVKPTLPCTLQPCPGELLSSWLVRLAHAHQVKVHSFCRHLWPDVSIWNRDIDKHTPTSLITTLSNRTLTPLDRIKQTTLAPLAERLTGVQTTVGHTHWLMPLGIYHRTHRRGGLVYCPHCLRNDGQVPYYRTSWRLAFYVACPTCGIYMHDACPACHKPINFFRIELGRKSENADRPISTCAYCEFDLTQSPAVDVPIRKLRLYRSLYRISREGMNQQVIYPHQYFPVLRQLIRLVSSTFKPAQALQLDLQLRRGHENIPVTFHTPFEKMSLDKRIVLLDEAMWLLEDWPDRFIALMRYHRLSSTTILKDMSGDIPFWFASVVYDQFFVSNVNRRFVSASPQWAEKRHDPRIAPIRGFVGGPRKYDPDRICPRCGSNWISLNGFRKNKQRFKCQQCQGHFTDAQ